LYRLGCRKGKSKIILQNIPNKIAYSWSVKFTRLKT
jgi:hypothetical protein